MGATLPESTGIYFSWGNTDGHPIGSGYNFTEQVYNETPAAAITEDLSLSQDAARVNLGTPWRMPTDAEFQELVDNCSSVWTSLNGMNGCLLTSNVNGRTLFLPAAGVCMGTQRIEFGSAVLSWSSTYYSATDAHNLQINSSAVEPQSNNHRRYGFTIRAVKAGTPNRSIVHQTTVNEPKEEETPTTEEPKDDNQR